MKRRTALATLLGVASAVLARGGSSADRPTVYEGLLRDGEAALARGDADAAETAFEAAAGMRHAADSEMGLVRTAMLRGRSGQALAFCAHTAGAHLDAAPAAALYAWLLRVSGQLAVAEDVLEKALRRSPDDRVLRAAREALAAACPSARGLLREGPSRMAPADWSIAGEPPPPDARVACGGAVTDRGARVVVPASAVAPLARRRLWVRNGLGATTEAKLEDLEDRMSRLAVLRLTTGLPAAEQGIAMRDPFAGSPGFVVGYALDPGALPAWPLLWQGFLGANAAGGARRLGIDVPPGSLQGGPVLDAAGRVAGLTVSGEDGLVFLPTSAWPQRVLAASGDATQAGPGPRGLLAKDQAYDIGLRTAVQVLVADSAI